MIIISTNIEKYPQEVRLPLELKKEYRKFIKQRLQEVSTTTPTTTGFDPFGFKQSQHYHRVRELDLLLTYLGKRDHETPSHWSMTSEELNHFIESQSNYRLEHRLVDGFRVKIYWEK